MDPITIATGLQIILQLTQAIAKAHANGDTTIPAETLKEDVNARNAAQKQLDDDLGGSAG